MSNINTICVLFKNKNICERKKTMAEASLEIVVMPDIDALAETEPLAAAAEPDSTNDNSALSAGIKTVPLPTASDTNGTEPVLLPVDALIAGSSFNVISTDQLQPLICVDNGLISGGSLPEGIKPTHIFIQSPPSPPQNEISSSYSGSWIESANKPVLPIRCKNTSAELHKQRLGSGGRGRCIRYGMEWYTPSEFEALCGLGSSKDWKHSIRFGGRSIKVLIDEGILTPHATNCTCACCCDNHTAMGPIRLFTPYKRKRQADWTRVSNHLSDISQRLSQMTAELKKCVEEAKLVNSKRMRLEQTKASIITAESINAQVLAAQLPMDNIEESEHKKAN